MDKKGQSRSRKSSDDEGVGKAPDGRPRRRSRHNSWNTVNRQKMMAHIPRPPSKSPPKESASNPGISKGESDKPAHHSAVEVTTWKDDDDDKKKKKTKTPYKPDFPKPEPLHLPISDLMKSFGIAKEKSSKKTDEDDDGDKLRNVLKSMKKNPEKFDPVLQHSIEQTRKTSATLKEKLKQHLSDAKRDSGVPIPLAMKKMDRLHKKKEEEVKLVKKEEEFKEDSDSDPFEDDTNLTRYHADEYSRKRRPYTEVAHMPHKDSVAEKEKRVAKRLSLEPKVEGTPAKDKTRLESPRSHRSSKDAGTTEPGSPPKHSRRTGSGIFNAKKQPIERIEFKPELPEPKAPSTQPTAKTAERKADLSTLTPAKETLKQDSQDKSSPVKAAPPKSDPPIGGKAAPPMVLSPKPIVIASPSPPTASAISKPPNNADVKSKQPGPQIETRPVESRPAGTPAPDVPALPEAANVAKEKSVARPSPTSVPVETKVTEPTPEKTVPVAVSTASPPSKTTAVPTQEPPSDLSVNEEAQVSPVAATPPVPAAVAKAAAVKVKEPPKQTSIYPERTTKPKQMPVAPIIITPTHATPKSVSHGPEISTQSTTPGITPPVDAPVTITTPIPVSPSNQTSDAKSDVDQVEGASKQVDEPSQVGETSPIIVKSGTRFATSSVPTGDSPKQVTTPPIKPSVAPKPIEKAATVSPVTVPIKPPTTVTSGETEHPGPVAAPAAVIPVTTPASASTKQILAAKFESLQNLPNTSKATDKSTGGKPPQVPQAAKTVPIKAAPGEVEKTKLPPISVTKPSPRKADTTVKARPTIRNLTARPGPATKPVVTLPTQEKKLSITPPASPVQENKISITPPTAPVQENMINITPPAAPVQEKKISITPPAAPVQEKKISITPPAAPVLEKKISITPPAAPVQEKKTSITPPAAPVQEKKISITAPAAPMQEKKISITAPAAPVQEKKISITPPAASVQEKKISITPPAAPVQEKKISITPPAAPVQEKKISIPPPPPQTKKLSTTPPVVQEKKLSATPPVVQEKKPIVTPTAAQESIKVGPPLQVVKPPSSGPKGRVSFGRPANEQQGTMDTKLPASIPRLQPEKDLDKGNVKFDVPMKPIPTTIVDDEDSGITDEELGGFPLDHKSGLILAQKILAKPKPKKPNSVKKLGEKNEGELAQGVLKVFTQKVLEGGDLSRLQDFGIPEQRKLLNLMLHSDFGDCDFGGYMRECYSPVLRGYCALNMQERYRGGGQGAPCFSALDLTKIGSVHQVKERERIKKLKDRDLHLEELRKVSIDDRHFKFLKELANNQPVSIPLTIIHELAVEILPMIKEMWEFYSKNLGANHECTVQAGRSFIRLLNRVIMYNAL